MYYVANMWTSAIIEMQDVKLSLIYVSIISWAPLPRTK